MVESFELWCEPFGENRRVNVYLPEGYYESEERYPVLYMFDGHNIFYDHEAAYGTSWGIKDFLDGWNKKLIVVGVYCSMHGYDRLIEYCPYRYTTRLTGKVVGTGKKTMDWFTGVLKDHIDKTYRTWWHREATAIGGSSMGGIMAFYAITRYNQYYSKAAVISPAFTLCKRQILREMEKAHVHPDTRVFFSWGSKEDRRGYLARTVYQLDDMLREVPAITYVYKHMGGSHCEACWAEEVPMWMDFLWK